jgi:hypothetical protein
MRLECTFAMYGGFWSDAALDALDGTTKRINNKTYFFNKKEGHLMVNFNMNTDKYTTHAVGRYLDFGVNATLDIDQTSILKVNKLHTVTVVSVCAEEGAIAIREVL